MGKKIENIAKSEDVVYTKDTSTPMYKDSLFTKIFSMPQHFKSVYGAILDKDISDKEVVLCNNEPLLTVDIRNDVAMFYEDRIIVFIEHQSTVNNNMPLRMLWYAGAAFKKYIGDQLKTVFGTKLIKLPKPEFYVFYAGEKHWDKKHLKLSDAYELLEDEIALLDLQVEIINMRDKDHPVMKRCQEAHVYIELIEEIEKLIDEGQSRDNAINIALTELSKKDSPLHNFILDCENEVKSMINYQLTLEEVAEHAQRIREQEVFEDGIEQGLEKGAHAKALETAKNALAMGLDFDTIAKITGLSLDEIERI